MWKGGLFFFFSQEAELIKHLTTRQCVSHSICFQYCCPECHPPPPPLCHLNQFAAAWMFILPILWLDRNPKRKAKVCAVLRCAPSYKSALLWRQSRGRVQLNLVLTKSLSPRLLPADDSVSYQGSREE